LNSDYISTPDYLLTSKDLSFSIQFTIAALRAHHLCWGCADAFTKTVPYSLTTKEIFSNDSQGIFQATSLVEKYSSQHIFKNDCSVVLFNEFGVSFLLMPTFEIYIAAWPLSFYLIGNGPIVLSLFDLP
jgi:hypothetical protein